MAYLERPNVRDPTGVGLNCVAQKYLTTRLDDTVLTSGSVVSRLIAPDPPYTTPSYDVTIGADRVVRKTHFDGFRTMQRQVECSHHTHHMLATDITINGRVVCCKLSANFNNT